MTRRKWLYRHNHFVSGHVNVPIIRSVYFGEFQLICVYKTLRSIRCASLTHYTTPPDHFRHVIQPL
ncbi:hypothetical protein HanIR_Chr10g0489531 [Helianthus annuus]|nr:hypothetical protein HanIR_Chr10g0489531 [Helianthus annuus]